MALETVLVVSTADQPFVVQQNFGNTAVAFFGSQGVPGPPGGQGSATVSIGTVTTLAAGSEATVTNSGTTTAAILSFSLPQGAIGATGPAGATGAQGPQGNTGATGATGAAATITIGTVTTGAAGSQATVTNVGSSSAAVLDFSIPQGAAGSGGSGSGTVSSIGLAVPSWLSVSGSPVTTSGTLSISSASTAANLVLASPNGSAGALTPRSLVAADLPLATVSAFGAVKPDGTTITISSGVISAVASSNINFADGEVPTGTINGTNIAFTLAHTPNPSTSLKLYKNGLRTTAFTLSGSTITYTTAPQSGDTHVSDYRY